MTKNNLPRIFLPALEMPVRKRLTIRPRSGQSSRVLAAVDLIDAPMQGLLLAAEDMLVLVGHVANLLDNECVAETSISKELVHLYEVVSALASSIREGKITSGSRLTIDDEAPAALEEALDLSYAEGLNWPETVHHALLVKLMDYWLDQIRTRGLSLLYLLIEA